MGDAITDIWKVLSHKDLKAAFSDTGNTNKFDWLELWVRDITTDQIFRNNMVERSLRWIRAGYTVSKLGWNVGVGLLQPLGLLQSSVLLGHKNMFWAIGVVLTGKQFGENSIYKYVQSETGMMSSRTTTWNKDISDAQRELKFTILDRITPGNSGQFIRDSLFFMIKSLQQLTDTITWLAAKRLGMEKFKGNETKARRFADRAVIGSQASGIFGERTNVERGSYDKKIGQTELIRSFSVFISYFMAKTNVTMRITNQTSFKSPAQVMRWLRDMLMLYTVEALMAALITNRWPDEEDEVPLVNTIIGETMSVVGAGIPGVREFVSEVQGFRGGGVPSAIARDFGRVFDQVSDGEIDEQLVMATNNFLGVLMHYPAAQINKSLRAYIASRDGEDVKAIECVETQTTRVDVAGNASTTSFSFSPMVIFANTELSVSLVVDLTGVETALTLTDDYTVVVASYPGTGTISYPASGDPLASGESLIIRRVLTLEQTVDLENQGGYFPDTQETALDKLVMLSLQQQEELCLTLRAVRILSGTPQVQLLRAQSPLVV